MRAAAACDRDSAASIDANRPVCGARGGEGLVGIPEEQRRTPFVLRRLCDRRHVKRSPLALHSRSINKEPATQRAGTKYNVPPDLPFHLPRFTAFLVLHDPYHRPSSSSLYETSLFLSRSHTFHPLVLSRFPSSIPPPPSSRRLLLFVPFSLFRQLLCIVREPSARS